jgi:hypothetical protein
MYAYDDSGRKGARTPLSVCVCVCVRARARACVCERTLKDGIEKYRSDVILPVLLQG